MATKKLSIALKELPLAEMQTAKVGGLSDYTEIEADGSLLLRGNATTFTDSMVPPTVFRTGGTSLTLAELVDGVYAHRFDAGDTIHFGVQFPHAMKLNTIIRPHVHLVNQSAIAGVANVTFTFTWTWANINGNFPAVTPDANKVISFADASALSHKLLPFDHITPIAGQGGLSSILLGTLTRVSAGYTANNIFLLGFDIHYEIDAFGSRLEFSK